MSTQVKISTRPSNLTRSASSRHSTQQKKLCQLNNRRASFPSGHPKPRVRPDPEEEQRLSREILRGGTRSRRWTLKWWKFQLFRGMIDNVKKRARFDMSD
jgi:hypothetical protein